MANHDCANVKATLGLQDPSVSIAGQVEDAIEPGERIRLVVQGDAAGCRESPDVIASG
jgi:hypothetical protein